MKPLFYLSILSLFIFFSCNRKDKEEQYNAGKGGWAILNIIPQHHGKTIDSCTIYIKYNATEIPQSYDDSAVCVLTDSIPVATFSELKKGNYYLYGRGYDPDILQVVEGGINVSITEENETTVYVPVTEGD